MTINTYRFHAKNLYNAWTYVGGVQPALTRDGLAQALQGAAIRELTTSPNSGCDVHIELARNTHHDALTEIETALANYAFYTVQAEVTEWATAVAEGALLGGSGGGAIGASTRSVGGFIIGAALGAIVGAIFGQAAQTMTARYRADRIAPGMWQFTPLPLPRPDFGTQQWGTQP